jgi:hypothetical protein
MTQKTDHAKTIEAAILKGMAILEQKNSDQEAETKRLTAEFEAKKAPHIARILQMIGHYFRDYIQMDDVLDDFLKNTWFIREIPACDEVRVYFDKRAEFSGQLRFGVPEDGDYENGMTAFSSLPEALAVARRQYTQRQEKTPKVLDPSKVLYMDYQEPVGLTPETIQAIRQIVQSELATHLAK